MVRSATHAWLAAWLDSCTATLSPSSDCNARESPNCSSDSVLHDAPSSSSFAAMFAGGSRTMTLPSSIRSGTIEVSTPM